MRFTRLWEMAVAVKKGAYFHHTVGRKRQRVGGTHLWSITKGK